MPGKRPGCCWSHHQVKGMQSGSLLSLSEFTISAVSLHRSHVRVFSFFPSGCAAAVQSPFAAAICACGRSVDAMQCLDACVDIKIDSSSSSATSNSPVAASSLFLSSVHAAFPRSFRLASSVCRHLSGCARSLARSPSAKCCIISTALHPGGLRLLLRTCVTPGAGSNGLHCSVAFVFCRPSCSFVPMGPAVPPAFLAILS